MKMGVEVDEYIIDSGVSGTKEPEKRQLGVLMEKLKPGDTIIASELSRLDRSLYMVMRILEFCMKHEVKVITVKEGYELGDNIQSKVLAFAFSLSAEIERNMISERTKEALRKKMQDGLIVGRAYGSKNTQTKLTKYDSDIREHLENGLSYSAIGRLLNVHRNTVKKYCDDNDLVKLHDKNCTKWRLTKKTLPLLPQICGAKDLLEKIDSGLNYTQIAEQVGLTKTSVANYIQKHPSLFKRFVKKQNEIRIKANGGLRINKGYRGMVK
jgi:DNA invertase Pin-like site-specific DNA recombinase